MTVAFYCSCGLAVKARGPKPLPAPSVAFVEAFKRDHLAEGHEEVGARACAVARRRAYLSEASS